MSDAEKIAALRKALADLLRQTADPDPVHPAYQAARQRAADAYHMTGDDMEGA